MAELLAFRDRLATAPISWGICEVPGWGPQLNPDRVLGEMQELGFDVSELGSPGFFPDDAASRNQLFDSYSMRLLGGFVPLVLHDPDQADAMLAEAEETAADLAASGAWHFITAAVTSADWAPREPLTLDNWDHLAAMLVAVEDICAAHGLAQVLHPHVGTVVETADDVEAVLARSSVRWCLDTGHLFIGGTDPLAFVEQHFERIGLVHLKDVVASVVPQLNRGDLTLMEAVQAGIFSNLGAGDVPIAAIIEALEARDFAHWYVVEQDTAIAGEMPEPGSGPIDDVRRSLDFLMDLPAARLQSGLENGQAGRGS